MCSDPFHPGWDENLSEGAGPYGGRGYYHLYRMGAEASFEEDEKGTLSVGKLADFAVLEQDIRPCAPDRIKDTAILAVYVGGGCVYKKENS